jgi:hypothetical protein
MRNTALAVLFALSAASAAHAVSLTTVIRACGDDSKALCKGVSYGAPMQACLINNKAKVTPACRKIAERLEKGEKVRVLGGSSFRSPRNCVIPGRRCRTRNPEWRGRKLSPHIDLETRSIRRNNRVPGV